jgi:hypothetical protein
VAHVILTCDMYKSSLRHIHDPVLSSLNMKVIRLLFYFLLRKGRLLDGVKKYLREKIQNRVLVKKLAVANVVNKFPAF